MRNGVIHSTQAHTGAYNNLANMPEKFRMLGGASQLEGKMTPKNSYPDSQGHAGTVDKLFPCNYE